MRNFGSAHPEGYRKAMRLMRLADKFGLPIITLIDTAGAYPGVGAEERHIAEAIAVNLREMTLFEVPIIAAVIGGCLLTGGFGSVIGAALGAVIFGVVQIGIGYTSIDNNWYRVFLGGMLLAAVLFNNYVRRRVALGRA